MYNIGTADTPPFPIPCNHIFKFVSLIHNVATVPIEPTNHVIYCNTGELVKNLNQILLLQKFQARDVIELEIRVKYK